MGKTLKDKHTEEDIRLLKAGLSKGGPIVGGDERIYAFYQKPNTTQKERIDFLKEEYGTGGGSMPGEDWLHYSFDYDGSGVKITNFHDNRPDIKFTWAEVDKILPEVLKDKETPYLNSLFRYKKGLFILPITYQNQSIADLTQTETDEYNRVYDMAISLYPFIKKCIDKNNEIYTFEQLYGKTQRIHLDNENKLQVAIVYCYDKNGVFNADKYNNIINKLAETHKDIKIYIPTNLNYHTSLSEYYGIPDKDTEKVYDSQKDIKNIRLFHEYWGIEEEYNDIHLSLPEKEQDADYER